MNQKGFKNKSESESRDEKDPLNNIVILQSCHTKMPAYECNGKYKTKKNDWLFNWCKAVLVEE